MINKSLQEIKQALKGAKTAVIASHIDPDGDSIGSALALAMILEKLGIRTTVYSQDGLPKVYHFLPQADKVTNQLPAGSHYDLAIAVDCSVLNRLGPKIEFSKIAKLTMNIDHHPDNSYYAAINFVKAASSVAELIYNLSVFLEFKLNKDMATCLYVAMMTDTGCFRYENTTAETLSIAADFLKAGVKPHEMTTRIYENKSVASLRIAAYAMSRLEFSKDYRVAWTMITNQMMKDVGGKHEDVIGIVDCIRSVEKVEVAILFKEDKGKIKINFRAKNKANVSKIAKHFGGGGHNKAAGAIMTGDIAAIKDQVVAEVIKSLKTISPKR